MAILTDTDYHVKIRMTERFLGTAPDPEIYEKYISSLAPEGTDTAEELLTLQSDAEERGTTRFHKDEEGLFIYNYMIVGFLKEAGNSLKEQLGSSGIKAVKSKIENFVFVSPRKIRFGTEQPDGLLDRPKRIDTPVGKKSVLGRSEYMDSGLELEFTIKVLKHKEITGEVIRSILEYGQFKGLGQWRNGGFGSFEVIEFEEV
jgi:hypothetical protein